MGGAPGTRLPEPAALLNSMLNSMYGYGEAQEAVGRSSSTAGLEFLSL